MPTYNVKEMRIVQPSAKVAEKNPDRFVTVYGKFFAEDGKTPLSISSKNISKTDAANPATVIDLVKGTLTLPENRRGRVASKGINQDEINDLLNSLRK